MSWLSGNALNYGLDDQGFESRHFLAIDFFFFHFPNIFCQNNGYSILCPVTGTIDAAYLYITQSTQTPFKFLCLTDDDNRIILKSIPEDADCQGDYINACSIDVR